MTWSKRLIGALPAWIYCSAPGAFLVFVSVIGLDRIPYFGGDEVWPGSTAWTFATEGRFAREITRGSLGTEVFDAFPPVWILSLAAVYKLLGVGVWTTRVPAVLAAAVAVSLLAATVRHVTGSKQQAACVGFLWALDPILLQRCRIGRSEPFSLLFLMVGLYLAFTPPHEAAGRDAVRARISWVLSGVAFVLAVGSYQFAALAVLGIVGGLAVTRQFDRLAYVCGGGVVGAGLWLAWLWGHIDYFKEQVLVMGQNYAQPLSTAVVTEWQRYALLVPFHAPIAILVFLVSPFAASLVLRNSADLKARSLAVAAITVFALLAAVGTKSIVYFLYLCPFAYFVIVACAAHTSFRWTWRALGMASAAGGALVVGGMWYKAAKEWDCRDSTQFERTVGRYMRPGDLIIGPGALWLPAIRRGARLRLTIAGYGPQSEPYQTAFLMDTESLSRAALIALEPDDGPRLLRAYPTLQAEVDRREKLDDVRSVCGASMFSMSIYGTPGKLGRREIEKRDRTTPGAGVRSSIGPP